MCQYPNKQLPQTEPKAHLFTQGTVAALLEPVQLVRLPQQGVEGLPCAVHRGGVRGDGEGRHVAQLLQGALAFGRLVEELVVLQVLREALKHGQRLVEVDLEMNQQNKHKIKCIFWCPVVVDCICFT